MMDVQNSALRDQCLPRLPVGVRVGATVAAQELFVTLKSFHENINTLRACRWQRRTILNGLFSSANSTPLGCRRFDWRPAVPGVLRRVWRDVYLLAPAPSTSTAFVPPNANELDSIVRAGTSSRAQFAT